MLMRLPLLHTGFILFVIAASQAYSQTRTLPLNANPNLRSAQSASLIHDSFDLSRNTVQNSTTPDASASSAMPVTQNAVIRGCKPVCGITHLGRCMQDLGEDKKSIFTSPLRLQPKDAHWLAPLGAATGLAFAYDADAAQAAGADPTRANTANKIADFGSFWATGAESVGVYFIGLAQKNPKLAETGRLGAEAIIDPGTVTLATKLVTNRQRPHQGNGQGDFWPYGTEHWQWDTSFPSDHATSAMALARIVAGEYPRWYVIVPAYGFVESISISRILANQHFPSDIVVGQAIRLSHRQLRIEPSRIVSSGKTRPGSTVDRLDQPRYRSANAHSGSVCGDSTGTRSSVLEVALLLIPEEHFQSGSPERP